MANQKQRIEFDPILTKFTGPGLADWKKLQKLEEKGVNIKVKLDFDSSSGGGYKKIQKLQESGMQLKTSLKLVGTDFNKIEKWIKDGITVKMRFSGVPGNIGRGFTSPNNKSQNSPIGPLTNVSADQVNRLARFLKGTSPNGSNLPSESYVNNTLTSTGLRNNFAELQRRRNADATIRQLHAEDEHKKLAKTDAQRQINAANFAKNQNQSALYYGRIQRENIARTLSAQKQEEIVAKKVAVDNFKFRNTQLKQQQSEDAKAAKDAKKIAIDNFSFKQTQLKQQSDAEKKTVQDATKQAVRNFTYQKTLNKQKNDEELRANNLAAKQAIFAFKTQKILNKQDDAELANTQKLIKQSQTGISQGKALVKRQFRDDSRLQQARDFVARSSPFSNIDDVREEAKFKFNLAPGQLGATRNRKLFDTKRITQTPGAKEDLFLAGLIGGPTAFVGGAIGGSLVPGRAGVAGGALAAEAIIGTIAEAGKFLADTFYKVGESGLEFERSILGIGAVGQATTRFVGSDGKALPISDQIELQQQRARQIQTGARAKLLPLGISGEREATLVQAISAGTAQKGVVLTPDQIATLSERIGAAVQAQRPELLNNPAQLRRDVEDLLSGLPVRTVLKAVIGGFAPGLSKATSADEFIKSSEGLKPFVSALKNDSGNAAIAVAKLSGALDQLTTTVGSELIKQFVPAIKELTKVVSDPELIESLTVLAKGVAHFAAEAIKFAAGPAGTLVSKSAQELSHPSLPGSIGGTPLDFALGAGKAGVSAGDRILQQFFKDRGIATPEDKDASSQLLQFQKAFIGVKKKFPKVDLLKVEEGLDDLVDQSDSLVSDVLLERLEKLYKAVEDAINKAKKDGTLEALPSKQIQEILKRAFTGVDDLESLAEPSSADIAKSPRAQLLALDQADALIPKLRSGFETQKTQVEKERLTKELELDTTSNPNKRFQLEKELELLDKAIDGLNKNLEGLKLENNSVFGSSVLREETLKKSRIADSNLFDTSTVAGAKRAAQQTLDRLPAEFHELNAFQLPFAREKLAQAQKKGDKNEIITATSRLEEIEQKLAEKRKETLAATEALISSEDAYRDKKIATRDAFTFQGQQDINHDRIAATTAKIDDIRKAIVNPELTDDQRSQLQLEYGAQVQERQQAKRDERFRPANKAQQQFSGIQAIEEFKKTQIEATIQLKKVTRSLTGYDTAVEGADLAIEELTLKIRHSSLTNEGRLVSAAEGIVNAGGSADSVNVDSSLVKGTAGFNAASRKEFDIRQAEASAEEVALGNRRSDNSNESQLNDALGKKETLSLERDSQQQELKIIPISLKAQEASLNTQLAQLKEMDGKFDEANSLLNDILNKLGGTATQYQGKQFGVSTNPNDQNNGTFENTNYGPTDYNFNNKRKPGTPQNPSTDPGSPSGPAFPRRKKVNDDDIGEGGIIRNFEEGHEISDSDFQGLNHGDFISIGADRYRVSKTSQGYQLGDTTSGDDDTLYNYDEQKKNGQKAKQFSLGDEAQMPGTYHGGIDWGNLGTTTPFNTNGEGMTRLPQSAARNPATRIHRDPFKIEDDNYYSPGSLIPEDLTGGFDSSTSSPLGGAGGPEGTDLAGGVLGGSAEGGVTRMSRNAPANAANIVGATLGINSPIPASSQFGSGGITPGNISLASDLFAAASGTVDPRSMPRTKLKRNQGGFGGDVFEESLPQQGDESIVKTGASTKDPSVNYSSDAVVKAIESLKAGLKSAVLDALNETH